MGVIWLWFGFHGEKAGASRQQSNHLLLRRTVRFDWLQGTSSNVFGWRSRPAIYKNVYWQGSETLT